MKRSLFLVSSMTLALSSVSAQTGYYSQSYSYGNYNNPGYNYYGAPPNSQGYYYPAQPPAYQPAPPASSNYFYGGVSRESLGAWHQQFPIGMYSPNPEEMRSKPIEIYLEKQVGKWGNYWFRVLGGSSTHPTPKGTFTVKSKYEDFYSRKYKAPMPLSVFFTDQCAIHIGSLRVRSHGCLHVEDHVADVIFSNSVIGKTKVKVYP